MKLIDEIKWCDKYKDRKEDEYEEWKYGKAIALSNGEPVSQKFIDFCDEVQVAVWEGKIDEEDMEKFIEENYRDE